MIGIVDYGMGNLHSIRKAFQRLNVAVYIIEKADDILKADKLILPGVGHFKNGMEKLTQMGYLEPLNKQVLENQVPVLGICLGAQLLTSHSEEGDTQGLGWIEATTKRFLFAPDKNDRLRVPHMGWNQLIGKASDPLLTDMAEDDLFYFVHSYYIMCKHPHAIVARTAYGLEFDSIIKTNNITGVQFHPEKSHRAGLKLLYNFAKS